LTIRGEIKAEDLSSADKDGRREWSRGSAGRAFRHWAGVDDHDLVRRPETGRKLAGPEGETDDRLSGCQARSTGQLAEGDKLARYQGDGSGFAHDAIPLRGRNAVERGIG
jgi:hypothetical protein